MARQSEPDHAPDDAEDSSGPHIRALVGDAMVFASNAGFANVVVFLSVFRASVTHMTGRARNLSVALESFDWRLVGVSIGLIAAFMAGSAISGLLVPDRDLDFGLPYRRVFFLEACMLTAAATLLVLEFEAGIYVAATAFGLQNGKATFYSGVVIRTSHVTGIITDIGVDIGLLLRRKRVPTANIVIKVGVLVGFTVGGVLGAMAFGVFGVAALYISAVAAAATMVGFWLRSSESTTVAAPT